VGAAAYALAFEELWQQIQETSDREPFHFDRIVFASSSGGTQAGLVVGARACRYRGQVLGISVDKTAGQLRETVSALLTPTAERLGLGLNFSPDDVQIDDHYLGGGYAVLTDAEREAIRLVARSEAILLDPVYTAKAMAGLLDLVRRSRSPGLPARRRRSPDQARAQALDSLCRCAEVEPCSKTVRAPGSPGGNRGPVETPYDRLLSMGYDRHEARAEVEERVYAVLADWQRSVA
jgi:hypothetical protein